MPKVRVFFIYVGEWFSRGGCAGGGSRHFIETLCAHRFFYTRSYARRGRRRRLDGFPAPRARESLCVHDGLRLDTPDALVCYMLPDAPVHDPRHFEALLGVSKEEMGYFGPILLDFHSHITSRMISRGVPGEFPTEGSVVAPKIRFFPKTQN